MKPGVPRWMWALVLAAATMPFWSLGHPLWEVDDARYAEVPREMVELKDWVVPRLDYMDYIEKPPLIYWLDAASYSLFGVSEASARLPLALLSLLGMAGAAWLGTWLFSPRVGLMAAVILASSAEYSVLSHLQTPDMAVSVCFLWACAFILRALHKPKDARWAAPAAGAAMGLAFLSKGLIALVFPCAWVVLIAILVPRPPLLAPSLQRNKRLSYALAAAAACFLAVSLPWVVLMQKRHPDFFEYFFIDQHFRRFLTNEYNRRGGWYYYIGVDAAGLLPWTVPAVAGLAAVVKGWRNAAPGARELALWVLFVLAFFTPSSSKLPTYILPIMPHQCLLAAVFLGGPNAGTGAGRRWAGFAGALLAWGSIPAAAWARGRGLMPPLVTPALFAAGACFLFALGSALLVLAPARAQDAGETAFRRASWAALAMTAFFLRGAHEASPWISAKGAAAEILSLYKPGDRIIAYDQYPQGIPFYVRRPVDVLVNWRGELRRDENDPRFKDRFGDENTIRSLPAPGKTTFVVLPKRRVSDFTSLAPAGKIKEMKRAGAFVLAVF